MKNKSILILAFIFFANLNFCYAQLTLENFYEFEPCSTKIQMFSTAEMNYYIGNGCNSVLIYNLDHTEYKTIYFQDEVVVEIHLASDKLFNSDEKIEFIMLTRPEDQYNNYTWKLANEDGEIIQILWESNCYFENIQEHNYVNYYKTKEGESKIIIRGPAGSCGNALVFSAPGNLTDIQLEMLVYKNSLIYPNPSSNYITLKIPSKPNYSDYLIIGANGITKVKGKIAPYTTEIKVNVRNYSKGTYILTYGTENYKFIVN